MSSAPSSPPSSGSAMYRVMHTDSERLGFLDADLVDLQPDHLHQLASRPDAMVVGLRDSTQRIIGFPPIGGERVLPRAVARGTDLAGGYRAEMRLAATAKLWGSRSSRCHYRGCSTPPGSSQISW
jgi:hypothetical protein